MTGKFCPSIESAPRTIEGAAAFQVAIRFTGQIRTAGMGAAATGMDIGDALGVLKHMGVDPDLGSELLSAISGGLVEAWNDRLPSQGSA